MTQVQRSKVYLVGVGLGAKQYLTLQAQAVLARADVAIYDALVDPEILSLLPAGCDRLFVGKRGGRPSTPQTEINRLLVERAIRGQQVVRLKNGDPFVFGRAREEMAALTAAGIPIEVVPGLSSALTAPLLAGIPLTDKYLGHSFAVCTGHQIDCLPWQALAEIDTLAILMGARNLPQLLDKLQQAGKPAATPVAVVRAAGTPVQQVWQGTLATILNAVADAPLSPAVIIVGETVRAIQHKEIPTMAPLAGKTILVTRAAQQADTFGRMLRERGATVVETPALEIRPPSSWNDLDRALTALDEFDWLVLASANGVECFCERLRAKGLDARALAGLKIAVVGRKTAAVLGQQGLKPDFVPANFVADALVDEFPEPIAGRRFLFPRVESGGRETLVEAIAACGGEAIEVAAYESGCPATLAPTARADLAAGRIDAITFASSKTVRNFSRLVASAGLEKHLSGICLASIGPQTSQACRETFGRVDLEAAEYTLEGLANALATWATRATRATRATAADSAVTPSEPA